MRGSRLLSVVYFMASTIGCFGQEGTKDPVKTPAADKGYTTIRLLGLAPDEFSQQEIKIRSSISSRTSDYCKEAIGNCRTDEKEIRKEDVIIIWHRPGGGGVDVRFFIKERSTEEEPALTYTELETFLTERKQRLRDDIGYTVELIDRRSPIPYEPWRIAVLTVVSFFVLVMIIAIISIFVKAKERTAKIRAMEYEPPPRVYESGRSSIVTFDDLPMEYQYATVTRPSSPPTPPPPLPFKSDKDQIVLLPPPESLYSQVYDNPVAQYTNYDNVTTKL